MTQTHAELKAKLEAQQDEQMGVKTPSNIEEKIEGIVARGSKMAEIKKAFYEEELLRKQIEAERDDNLLSYLDVRKERNLLMEENNNLKKEIQEADVEKAKKTVARERTSQYDYNAQAVSDSLWKTSRENFKELLANKKAVRGK